MTFVVDFLIGIFGRVCSGLISTYLVRLFDKLRHKKDRHSPKSGL